MAMFAGIATLATHSHWSYFENQIFSNIYRMILKVYMCTIKYLFYFQQKDHQKCSVLLQMRLQKLCCKTVVVAIAVLVSVTTCAIVAAFVMHVRGRTPMQVVIHF